MGDHRGKRYSSVTRLEEIHVQFITLERAPGGELSIVYVSKKQTVLEPGKRYRFVIDGITYAESGRDDKKKGGQREKKAD